MIFIGSYPFSWTCLNQLLKLGLVPNCIVTIEGDSKGQYSFYSECTKSHHLTNVEIIKIEDKKHLQSVHLETTDYIICCAFPFLLPSHILASAKKLSINVHPSILPMWRGPDPLRNAIVNNDPFLGVSLHSMTNEFDKGQILSQYSIANDMESSLSFYLNLFATMGASMLYTLISNQISLRSNSASDYLVFNETPYAKNLRDQLSSFKETAPLLYRRLTN